jgi:hypothetical protein
MDYKSMTDDELLDILRAVGQEQARRAAIPEDDRPDPEIRRILQERRENLYGRPRTLAEQIAQERHKRLWG